MQNLRQLSLFQLYRKLPFIVYKSAYLIPQWPLPNRLSNELIGLRKLEQKREIAKYLKKTFPKGEEEGNGGVTLSNRAVLQEHISLYILPLMKSNSKSSIPQKKAKATKRSQASISQLYQKQFRFPVLPFYSVQQMHQMNRKKGKKKLASLTVTEKKELKKKFATYQKQYIHNLKSFLEEYKLNVPQFLAITNICDKTSEIFEQYQQYQDLLKKKEKILKETMGAQEFTIIQKLQRIQSEEGKLLKAIKQDLKFISLLPQNEYAVYESLFSAFPNPVTNFKKEKLIKFQQDRSSKLSKQSSSPTQEDKQQQNGNIAAKIESKQEVTESKATSKTLSIAEQARLIQVPIYNMSVPVPEPEQQNIPQNEAKEVSAQVVVQTEKSDLTQNRDQQDEEEVLQMKDEDLDNMDILEDDYEVLRLTKLIKKSKSALKKIPIKI